MDTSSEIKDSMMFPEKPLRKFGNRRFCCNGRCSILTNCVGLPLTVLMSIYSIVQILYFINKFITISSSIRICFFISHIAMFFLVLSQTLIVSLSNSGFFYPKKEILSSDSRLKTMIANISNQDFFLKYCITCNIVRDLRVFHCKHCNLCVLRHDHHCPWLSVCIGYRNHKKFLFLLFLTVIYLILNGFTISIILINPDYLYFSSKENEAILQTKDYIFGSVFCIILLLLFIFVITLIWYQCYFISTNQTTSENLRRNKNAKNPYTMESCSKNQSEFFIDPLGYKKRIQYNDSAKSFLELSSLLTDYIDNIDKTFPLRKNMIKEKEEKKEKDSDEISRQTEMTLSSIGGEKKERASSIEMKQNDSSSDKEKNLVDNVV